MDSESFPLLGASGKKGQSEKAATKLSLPVLVLCGVVFGALSYAYVTQHASAAALSPSFHPQNRLSGEQQDAQKVVYDGMDLTAIKELSSWEEEGHGVHSLQMEKMTQSLMKGTLHGEEWFMSFEMSMQPRKARFECVSEQADSRQLLETNQNEQGEQTNLYSESPLSSDAPVARDFNAEDFLASRVATHMVELSYRLAEHGLVGPAAPVLKAFHTMARQVAKTVAHELPFDAGQRAAQLSHTLAANQKELFVKPHWGWWSWPYYMDKCENGDKYYGCRCSMRNACGNPCMGLCGLDCGCWYWICGTCSCECFCKDHDEWCSCGTSAYSCMSFWDWADACCAVRA